jgi:N-acetylglucosamine-6-phosphate deacetylase
MRSEGLFDLQVNGFAGVDFNSEGIDAAALDHALDAMLAGGVTACLPTLITAPAEVLAARFAALDRAVRGSPLAAALVPGYHLEGPFLNATEGYAGCHPASAMGPPDAALVERLETGLSRPILLVTVAPELPAADRFIAAMTAAGRVVALGHSAADSETVARAAEAGARLSTHLGNGLPQVLHKVDNPIFAQLAEDRLSASFIADGIHLPAAALKTMLRAKGVDRAILVSDAVAAAGAPPGRYAFAGMSVEHAADGSVRVPGSRSLAGSALTLDAAIRNVVRWGLGSFDDAVRMAGRNPRRLMAESLGRSPVRIEAGDVTWSPDLRPLDVRVGPIRRSCPQVAPQGPSASAIAPAEASADREKTTWGP